MGIGMMTFGLWMMLLGLLVLVGVVALGVWVAIRLTGTGTGTGTGGESGEEARKILDQRLARGEIDHEEYRRIRRELG